MRNGKEKQSKRGKNVSYLHETETLEKYDISEGSWYDDKSNDYRHDKSDDYCKCPDIQQNYEQINMVSSIGMTAKVLDTALNTPWGIAQECDKLWVSLESPKLINVYSKYGDLLKSITSTNSPTGIIVNCTENFKIQKGASATLPSTILVCTIQGTIEGYNENVDANTTVIGVTTPGIYTGLAIHRGFLYAANFSTGNIDKYNGNFVLVGSFSDPNLKTIRYHPYNVYSDGCKLYVSFALHDPATGGEIAGIGNGYVDVFENEFSFKRLIDRGHLNAPWGMWKCDCILYVGNVGNGTIKAYSAKTGEYMRTLSTRCGHIIIDRIRGFIGDIEFKPCKCDNRHQNIKCRCKNKCKKRCDDDKKLDNIIFAFSAAINQAYGLIGYFIPDDRMCPRICDCK